MDNEICSAILAKVIQYYNFIPILIKFFLLSLKSAIDEMSFENIMVFLLRLHWRIMEHNKLCIFTLVGYNGKF